jgi:hypothetical protein
MSNPILPPRWEALKTAVRSLGIEQPQLLDARTSEDLERAFETMVERSVDAVIVENDGPIPREPSVDRQHRGEA